MGAAADVRFDQAMIDVEYHNIIELRSFGRYVYVLDRRRDGYTLDNIAARIGRSRERVRQMEAKAKRMQRRALEPVHTPYAVQCLVALGWE